MKKILAKSTLSAPVVVEVLLGDKKWDALKLHLQKTKAVEDQMRRTFPTDDDQFEFLEKNMMVNAMRSMKRFEDTFDQMTPVEAAKAAGTFTGKALDIKKARETGFREPPINVSVILSLEQTLKQLTPPANGQT